MLGPLACSSRSARPQLYNKPNPDKENKQTLNFKKNFKKNLFRFSKNIYFIYQIVTIMSLLNCHYQFVITKIRKGKRERKKGKKKEKREKGKKKGKGKKTGRKITLKG